MSTRSNIIFKHPKTWMFHSVYCHSDGYLSHNGMLLQNHYNSLELATAVVALGGISSLGDTFETTRSYNLWRNEPINIRISANLNDHCEEEYYYLFIDGKWMVNDHGKGWCDLELALSVDDQDDILCVSLDAAGQLVLENNS